MFLDSENSFLSHLKYIHNPFAYRFAEHEL